DHLDLTADGTGEVRRLVEGGNLDFLDALNGSGHNPGRATTGLASAGASEVGDVAGIVAGHVIGVVAAIQHEDVLVGESSGRHAARRGTRLQHRQGGHVAAHV